MLKISKILQKIPSAHFQNYFKLFDLKYDSNQSDLKTAYLLKAKEYHPDLNKEDKNAGENFMKIREAYLVLRDDNKREEYLRTLKRSGVIRDRTTDSSLKSNRKPIPRRAKKSKSTPHQESTTPSNQTYTEQELRQAITDWEKDFSNNFYFKPGGESRQKESFYQAPKIKLEKYEIDQEEGAAKSWHSWSDNFTSRKR